jgi:hypothetical protein
MTIAGRYAEKAIIELGVVDRAEIYRDIGPKKLVREGRDVLLSYAQLMIRGIVRLDHLKCTGSYQQMDSYMLIDFVCLDDNLLTYREAENDIDAWNLYRPWLNL